MTLCEDIPYLLYVQDLNIIWKRNSIMLKFQPFSKYGDICYHNNLRTVVYVTNIYFILIIELKYNINNKYLKI